MDYGELYKQIGSIHSKYPCNLMAGHFNDDYFHSLEQSKRDRLFQIIRSGLENTDSQMGANTKRRIV
jgi:hypothetical protein